MRLFLANPNLQIIRDASAWVKPRGVRVPAGSYEAQFLAEVVMLFAAVARHNPLSGLKQ